MHYLITGGAGFIGSNLTRRILEEDPGARITCIDNFDPFYSEQIKRFNVADFVASGTYNLIEEDLSVVTVSALNKQIIDPVDVIVHLAAKAGVRPSIMDPAGYQRANIIGLQTMLDFAKENNIEQFVFASTSSVYGINDHFPWREDEQLLPISPYAMTKLSGEMLGHVYHKLFGIRFLALRFFTVYGPGQRPDLAIHKFTKAILNEQPIPMYGNGTTSRDYTFVSDTVGGILSAIKYKNTGFEIINLGNNVTVTLNDLIRAIEDTVGKKAIIEHHPDQPGDVPITYADISKAERILNYHPKVKLKDGLASFYEWFSENRELLK
jgi:UDP-glucuronate 4-epimerase